MALKTAAVLVMEKLEFENKTAGNSEKLSTGLTVRVDAGAECTLYEGAPPARKYETIVSEGKAIEPTAVTVSGETSSYYYADLKEGVYHALAVKEGYMQGYKPHRGGGLRQY